MIRPFDVETGFPQQHFLEIDWRELEPYFTELQECASFWILVNLVGDMVYSTLIIVTLFLKTTIDSPFFQGMHSHINPVLMYLIISLIVNFASLKANQASYEKCFLMLSIVKTLLFLLTLGPFLYLILSDVQDYFGDFWTSLVIICGSYNSISALSLWSMYIFNKFIYINESAQIKQRMVNMSIFSSSSEEEDEIINQSTSATSPSCYCDECKKIQRSFIDIDRRNSSTFIQDSPAHIWTVFKLNGRQRRRSSLSIFDDFDELNWASIDDISNFKITL